MSFNTRGADKKDKVTLINSDPTFGANGNNSLATKGRQMNCI